MPITCMCNVQLTCNHSATEQRVWQPRDQAGVQVRDCTRTMPPQHGILLEDHKVTLLELELDLLPNGNHLHMPEHRSAPHHTGGYNICTEEATLRTAQQPRRAQLHTSWDWL